MVVHSGFPVWPRGPEDPRLDGPSAGELRSRVVEFAGCEFLVEFDDLALISCGPRNPDPAKPWEQKLAEVCEDEIVQLATEDEG